MDLKEHDYEPIRGLPAPLPAGERVLWQGAPDWSTLNRRMMRLRWVSVYFLGLVLWGISGGVSAGDPATDVVLSALRLAGLGAVAVAVLAGFAYLVARTTAYTLTNRRVVIRFGIAFPITLQIPFSKIETAGLHVWPNGAGDIPLVVLPGQKISYFILWPHVRPWKLARTQPMLRGIPNAASVAQTLSRALAASIDQPVPPIRVVQAAKEPGLRVPAAA
ncbi:MAG: photosynthetic complex putative assembly protein PuhB [Rhodopila sp.]